MTKKKTYTMQGELVMMFGSHVTVRHGKPMPGHVFCNRARKSVPIETAATRVMDMGPAHKKEVCVSGCGSAGFSCLPI